MNYYRHLIIINKLKETYDFDKKQSSVISFQKCDRHMNNNEQSYNSNLFSTVNWIWSMKWWH